MITFYLCFAGIVFVFLYWNLNFRAVKPLLITTNVLFLVSFSSYFFALHLVSALANFIASKLAQTQKNSAYLIVAITTLLNLIFIFYHKFLGLQNFKYVIPLGLSYYTLINLGYVLDVYKKQAQPIEKFTDFYLFSGFFPCILMGPIERADDLFPQLIERKKWQWSFLVDGLYLISLGVFKKFVIADRLYILADEAQTNATFFEGSGLWLFFLLCFIQIYCDFSSYIDIVRGFARLLGMNLSENFKQPYLAKSIPEIWRRWNMTLVDWLRRHLYVPVLMKTKNMYLSVFLVMMAIGLWHHLSINMMLWALYWSLLYFVHIYIRVNGILFFRNNKIISVALMLLAMCFSSIFLVTTSVAQLISITANAFRFNSPLSSFFSISPLNLWDYAIVAASTSLMVLLESFQQKAHKSQIACSILVIFMLILSMLFGVSDSQMFIYMRF